MVGGLDSTMIPIITEAAPSLFLSDLSQPLAITRTKRKEHNKTRELPWQPLMDHMRPKVYRQCLIRDEVVFALSLSLYPGELKKKRVENDGSM